MKTFDLSLLQNKSMTSRVSGVLLITGLIFTGCERPSSPDFETDHAIDIPLINNSKIEMIGGRNALIDTTDQDIKDLIAYGEEGLVRFSSEIDGFQIGDFDGAIPELDIESQLFSSEIGVIEIDDFEASFETEIGVLEAEPKDVDSDPVELGNFEIDFEAEGQTDFETITGEDPAGFQQGTPIPAGEAEDVIIDIDEDSFEQAVIESGEIELEFENNLGFDLSEVSFQLLSGGTAPVADDGVPVGDPVVLEDGIDHNETKTASLVLHQGELLEQDLALNADFSWNDQNMQDEPGDFPVEAKGQDFIVQSATADIPAQELDITPDDITLGDDSFEYALLHDSGQPGDINRLTVEFTNNSELPLSNADQTDTPQLTLLNDNGEVLDQPRNLISQQDPNANQIDQGETGAATFDLNGYEITRNLSFEIELGTPGGDPLTVSADDEFDIFAEMGELRVQETRSDIDPQQDIIFEDEVDVDGDFTEAEVEEGELEIEMLNQTEIPITVENLEFFNAESFRARNTGNYFAAGSEIGSLNNVEVPAGETVTETIDISGRGISSTIAYDGTGSSPGSDGEQVTISASDKVATNAFGAITVSSADAVIESQSISTNEVIDLDTDAFTFETENDYVDLKSGYIQLNNLINNIDLDVDTLQISFPTIYKLDNGHYNPEDTLTVLFAGDDRILRSSADEVRDLEIPLAGHRLTAPDNELKYHIYGVTENTRDHPQDDTLRTINADDDIEAELQVENLEIQEVSGIIEPRTLLLNDDADGDGNLDIFNDVEAEITEFDDFDFGEELNLDELEVLNSELNLTYSTNLEAESYIYAVIAGTDENGETVYLSGEPGTDFEVAEDDTVSGFYANGSPVTHDQLIRFPVEGPADEDQPKAISFSKSNSNIDEFISHLPEEIRFIGKSLVNPNRKTSKIIDPISFDTELGIDLPLNFATPENPASFSSRTAADLSELSSFEELRNANVQIQYNNTLPLQARLKLEFFDADDQLITTLPIDDEQMDRMKLRAAPIDPDTRFATEASADIFEVSLNAEQINNLHRTDSLNYAIEITTTDREEIKLRKDDGIELRVGATFRFNTKID